MLSRFAAWMCLALVVAAGLISAAPLVAAGAVQSSGRDDVPTFVDAQLHFYNARYDEASAVALALRKSEGQDLANDELRTSALLFQLKRLLEEPAAGSSKSEALKKCVSCPELMTAFFDDIHHGQTLARARLRTNPADETALFFLGKLDLNYVWLQLGLLGRRTGWDEYWEARHSLDAVLKIRPQHVRAVVARAWIDYIVDTKMPWGTGWVLGGGSKKRALAALGSAARIESEFFSHAESEFALWDMQVRESNLTQATEVARRLVRDFPDNRDLARFLEAREADARR